MSVDRRAGDLGGIGPAYATAYAYDYPWRNDNLSSERSKRPLGVRQR